jgi:hypothetical protein
MVGDGGWSPPDNKVASPNASELDSASLHQWQTANLPNVVKPEIDREATDVCTCRVARGDWRERTTKEPIWYPGYPLRSLEPAIGTGQDNRGNHNPISLRQWKSDRFIVAMKWGNAHGAKEPDRCRVSPRKGVAA